MLNLRHSLPSLGKVNRLGLQVKITETTMYPGRLSHESIPIFDPMICDSVMTCRIDFGVNELLQRSKMGSK